MSDMVTKRTIEINGKVFPAPFFHGQPLVTFSMVDQLHGRPGNTSNNVFLEIEKSLKAKKDYFRLAYNEWKAIWETDGNRGGHKSEMIFLTISGYLKITAFFEKNFNCENHIQILFKHFRKKPPISEAAVAGHKALIAELRADIKALQLEKNVCRFVAKSTDDVLEHHRSMEDFDHVPTLKELVEKKAMADERWKQMGLFGN